MPNTYEPQQHADDHLGEEYHEYLDRIQPRMRLEKGDKFRLKQYPNEIYLVREADADGVVCENLNERGGEWGWCKGKTMHCFSAGVIEDYILAGKFSWYDTTQRVHDAEYFAKHLYEAAA